MDLFEDEKMCFVAVNTICWFRIFFAHNNLKLQFVYDQIVSYGELISTTILSHFMGIKNNWLDVRNFIKRMPIIEMRKSIGNWHKKYFKNVKQNLNITQGFLDENNTTTLGREGSDYTAIFAYCLNAQRNHLERCSRCYECRSRYFENASLLNQISYHEAIEHLLYGATVIHQKHYFTKKRKFLCM
jgi:aspartate kinase